MTMRLAMAAILAFFTVAPAAGAETLIRWDLPSVPSPQALGISTLVIPAAQEQGIKQALAQGVQTVTVWRAVVAAFPDRVPSKLH